MWKKLPYHLPYFILYTEEKSKPNPNEKVYDILVTNYVEIWSVFYFKSGLLEALLESNDGLEIPEEILLQKGIDMIVKPEELKNVKIDVIEKECLDVTLTKSYGFPLRLKLKMLKGSDTLFYDTVTLPLLKTVNMLRSSQEELCNLLKKKDKEIEEYKCEGGKISLRHLKTVPFNEEIYLNKHNVFEDYFETFDSRLLENKLTINSRYFTTRGESASKVSVKSELSNSTTSNTQNESNISVKLESSENATSSTQNIISENSTTLMSPNESSISNYTLNTIRETGTNTASRNDLIFKLEPEIEEDNTELPCTAKKIKSELKTESQSSDMSTKRRKHNLKL